MPCVNHWGQIGILTFLAWLLSCNQHSFSFHCIVPLIKLIRRPVHGVVKATRREFVFAFAWLDGDSVSAINWAIMRVIGWELCRKDQSYIHYSLLLLEMSKLKKYQHFWALCWWKRTTGGNRTYFPTIACLTHPLHSLGDGIFTSPAGAPLTLTGRGRRGFRGNNTFYLMACSHCETGIFGPGHVVDVWTRVGYRCCRIPSERCRSVTAEAQGLGTCVLALSKASGELVKATGLGGPWLQQLL